MMTLSQKCQYALRAVFELARQGSKDSPVKIAHVAKAQGIPLRFLENILNELKRGGFVSSTRGKQGGYALAKPAAEISMVDVVRFIDGDVMVIEENHGASIQHNRVFGPTWRELRDNMRDVLAITTFEMLVRRDQQQHADNLMYFI